MRIGLDARKLWDGGIGTYIRCFVSSALKLSPEHRFVAFLDPADVERAPWSPDGIERVPVRAGKYSLLEHWVLPRAARRAHVELFHAPHYTLPLGWRGPAVVTIHDLTHVRYAHFYPPGAGLYARAVAGAAARRAGQVIADSAATRADVIELLHVPEERVRVVPLGVSDGIGSRPAAEVAAFARERVLPDGYLLYVGARKRHKNIDVVIRALAALKAADRPAFGLSGARWEPDHRLAQLAEAGGLTPLIHFAGELRDDRELSCLYSGASLYLQPSLIEGFGLPPLEAMACGVPVIASGAEALRETLGDAALLLDPHDVEAWSDGIASLLRDSEHRADLARRGRDRARAFTWDRTATQTLAIYDLVAPG